MTPPLDYTRQAEAYAEGRSLDDQNLARWRTAIAALCPIEGSTVIDVGSGTGIFTSAWSDWGARLSVGCEPSAAMRSQARRSCQLSRTALVAGRAEELPFPSSIADVVWTSTVIHHIGDLNAWASESQRVLRLGATLLVRNLFADLGATSWLAEIPGADRARTIFPTVGSVVALLAGHHMRLVAADQVSELAPDRTARAATAWIRAMRKADSLLLAFSDGDIERGLAQLESYPPDHMLPATSLGLLTFRCLK